MNEQTMWRVDISPHTRDAWFTESTAHNSYYHRTHDGAMVRAHANLSEGYKTIIASTRRTVLEDDRNTVTIYSLKVYP